MTVDDPTVNSIKMMDEKVKPLWNKKLDKWVFIPTISLIILLLGVVFTVTLANPSSTEFEDLKEDVEKYEGMELRLTNKMNEYQDKIIDKIDGLKR